MALKTKMFYLLLILKEVIQNMDTEAVDPKLAENHICSQHTEIFRLGVDSRGATQDDYYTSCKNRSF